MVDSGNVLDELMLNELILASLNGEIGEERFAWLDMQIAENPAAAQHYVEFMAIYTGLRQLGDVSVSCDTSDNDDALVEKLLSEAIEYDEKVCAELAAEEVSRKAEAEKEAVKKTAEKALEKFREEERRRQEKLAYELYKAQRRGMMFGIGSLAACLVLVVFVLFYNKSTSVPAAPPIVASITQSLDAQWDDSGISTVPGTQLTASTMQLKRGLIQIAFESGAEVIFQAPCRIKLENTNQVFLEGGNLTAVVPKRAKGFTVCTRGATIVDYGTEFGVMANVSGETEVHVFKGEVDLRSGPDARVFEKSQRIKACQAGMVDSQGSLSTRKIKYQAKRFIRKMPVRSRFGRSGERLDLADVIGGGNGFGTGDPNQSISPNDGQIRPGFYNRNHKAVPGSSDFIPIGNMDFIDGVFIPDGGDGPVVVSSQGHIFHDCPDTNSKFCWDIFNGDTTNLDDLYRTLLDGRKYGTFTHPAITIHSNAGITFDLDKIRAPLGGNRLVAFTTLCGLSDRLFVYGHQDFYKADFWVLVDGQIRFKMTGSRWQMQASSVRVNLNEHDKFLTLAVTDGGKSLNKQRKDALYDWGIFAEPALILSPENF